MRKSTNIKVQSPDDATTSNEAVKYKNGCNHASWLQLGFYSYRCWSGVFICLSASRKTLTHLPFLCFTAQIILKEQIIAPCVCPSIHTENRVYQSFSFYPIPSSTRPLLLCCIVFHVQVVVPSERSDWSLCAGDQETRTKEPTNRLWGGSVAVIQSIHNGWTFIWVINRFRWRDPTIAINVLWGENLSRNSIIDW